ncbi:MAG: HlyD family efflux transporter periplasmic adaptor subunit [Planctomycetia bacterium]|nr:HlyD family efflux transporter periplasmic adaptor subunit [Planctomycetia bacterium]
MRSQTHSRFNRLRTAAVVACGLASVIGAQISSVVAQSFHAKPAAPQSPVEPPQELPVGMESRPINEARPNIDPHRAARGRNDGSVAPTQFVDRYGSGGYQAPAQSNIHSNLPTSPSNLPQGGAIPPSSANGSSANSAALGGTAAVPVLRHCVVKLIDQVTVSVQEPGIVTALEVREGMMVEAEAQVGRVSDSQSRMAKLVAEAEHKIAQDRAGNDIEIRYAESAAKVAEFEYRAGLQANQKAANSISQVKLQEMALSYEKAQRQIEQAQHNLQISKEEAEAKRVEVDAAEDSVRRRQITSPIGGEVVEVPVHVGEWVQPGDPIFRIIRLDQLAVEGFLRAADYTPGEIVGKPVVVELLLARGRPMQFTGKVTFVHPEIDGRGQFRVKAEVTNVAENGQYLLRPGHDVDMAIRTDAAAAAPIAMPTEPAATTPPVPLTGSLPAAPQR